MSSGRHNNETIDEGQ